MKTVTIITGSLGRFLKKLAKKLKERKIRGRHETFQIKALLESAKNTEEKADILKKFIVT